MTLDITRVTRQVARSSIRALTRKSRLARLDDALGAGFPADLATAFRVVIGQDMTEDARAIRDIVEARRKLMLQRSDLVHFDEKTFPVSHVARVLSVSNDWGLFLHLASRAIRAEYLLELGTAGGISGSYLATIPSCKTLISIDAAAEAQAVARENLEACAPGKYRLINGYFDEVLDELLTEGLRFDFAWLDGHHEKLPTLHYLQRVSPHLRPGALVVFDDIRWSDDMFDCWRELRSWPGFAHMIDAGKLGVGVWSGDADSKPYFWDLSEACSPGLARKMKMQAA